MYDLSRYGVADSPDYKMSCSSPYPLYEPDGELKLVVGCGKCPACRAKVAFNKRAQIKLETLAFINSGGSLSDVVFLTTTYAEVPKFGELSKTDHQLFMKRLRKAASKRGWPTFRFFVAGEYGGEFKRPHLHYVLWNFPGCRKWSGDSNKYCDCDVCSMVREAWGHGLIDLQTPRDVDAVANYVSNYVTQMQTQHDPQMKYKAPEFRFGSSGIGRAFADTLAQNYLQSQLIAEDEFGRKGFLEVGCDVPQTARIGPPDEKGRSKEERLPPYVIRRARKMSGFSEADIAEIKRKAMLTMQLGQAFVAEEGKKLGYNELESIIATGEVARKRRQLRTKPKPRELVDDPNGYREVRTIPFSTAPIMTDEERKALRADPKFQATSLRARARMRDRLRKRSAGI